MAFSLVLAEAGLTAERIETEAMVTLDVTADATTDEVVLIDGTYLSCCRSWADRGGDGRRNRGTVQTALASKNAINK